MKITIRVLGILFAGIVCFLFPFYNSFLGTHFGELISTFGSLLIGSAIVDGLYQISFQRKIKAKIDTFSENISVLEEYVITLGNNITTLQDTVAIASGAVESGLTAVYSSREECLIEIKKLLNSILSQIDSKKQKGAVIISILGISLGDFLCPHGSLQPIFRDVLKHEDFSIKLAILKDGCNSALYRAVREEYSKFKNMLKGPQDFSKLDTHDDIKKTYERTKCHDELKTATDYLEDLSVRHVIDRDEPGHDGVLKAKIETHLYQENPMVFMFVLNDDMFIESYHLAGRGGEAPILRVSRYKKQGKSEESRLFKIFINHFNSVIDMSEEFSNKEKKDDRNATFNTEQKTNNVEKQKRVEVCLIEKRTKKVSGLES